MKTYNVVIGDRNEILAKGIRAFLENESKVYTEENPFRFKVEALIFNTEELKNQLKINIPDIFILDDDILNPVLNEYLLFIEKLPVKPKTIITTHKKGIRYFNQIFKTHIEGIIPKQIKEQDIMQCLISITNGNTYHHKEVSHGTKEEQLEIKAHLEENSTGEKLSSREIEILQLTYQEYSNKEIADILYISKKTVDAHKSRMMVKTGTQNAVGLIKYCFFNDLIPPDDNEM